MSADVDALMTSRSPLWSPRAGRLVRTAAGRAVGAARFGQTETERRSVLVSGAAFRFVKRCGEAGAASPFPWGGTGPIGPARTSVRRQTVRKAAYPKVHAYNLTLDSEDDVLLEAS
ncbi:hypothetical protein GCM10020254_08790 [Streptomyces goshikiensis]